MLGGLRWLGLPGRASFRPQEAPGRPGDARRHEAAGCVPPGDGDDAAGRGSSRRRAAGEGGLPTPVNCSKQLREASSADVRAELARGDRRGATQDAGVGRETRAERARGRPPASPRRWRSRPSARCRPPARRRRGSRGSSRVARSTISLQKPVVRPSMIVRVVASKRTTATTTSCVSRAFASVRPDLRVLGVGEAADRAPPRPRSPSSAPRTALVAATKPSCIACGTSIRRPVTSPAAKMCGAEVRRWASTRTKPRGSVSTPAVARSSPAVSAVQPTATTTSAASALSRAPSFEKIIRTPPGVLSKRLDRCRSPRAPRCPPRERHAATAADTSSSSVGRMRGRRLEELAPACRTR